jgi:hypothetical protein
MLVTRAALPKNDKPEYRENWLINRPDGNVQEKFPEVGQRYILIPHTRTAKITVEN